MPMLSHSLSNRGNVAWIRAKSLLLLLLATLLVITALLGSLGLLSADTTWASSTKWRAEGEVDVLLGVETDNEGWDVDDLLADAGIDVSRDISLRW